MTRFKEKLYWLGALVVVALLVSGCTIQGQAARSAVVNAGVKAMDEALIAAEFVICKGASVGSIQRRYGSSEKLSEAWRTLCLPNRGGGPVPFASERHPISFIQPPSEPFFPIRTD